jgi:hypothetical protein
MQKNGSQISKLEGMMAVMAAGPGAARANVRNPLLPTGPKVVGRRRVSARSKWRSRDAYAVHLLIIDNRPREEVDEVTRVLSVLRTRM